VWVTRYRRQILNPGVGSYLRASLQEVREYHPDWEYISIGIDKDHIHLHMIIPPKYSVSEVVNALKANTSRAIKEKFEFLKKVYWDERGIWSKGYFVSTVGIEERVIKRYVEMQGKEDAGQAELEF
jgi:putative transposase